MQVSELSPAELAKIRAKVKPVVDKFSHDIGDAMTQLNAEIVKARK
jgi:hypothetical protein